MAPLHAVGENRRITSHRKGFAMKLHPLVGVILGALLASEVWFFAYQANANQLKQTTAIRISSNFK
jgi:ABC-type enterochelin transport system permease subunit